MSSRTKQKYVAQEVLEYVLPKENQQIVKVTSSPGNHLYGVVTADGEEFLASLPKKYRCYIYIKLGKYVIVEPISEGNRVKAEIVHVLLYDSHLQYIDDNGLWPAQFTYNRKTTKDEMISADMLPPSDSESESDCEEKASEEEDNDSEEEEEDRELTDEGEHEGENGDEKLLREFEVVDIKLAECKLSSP